MSIIEQIRIGTDDGPLLRTLEEWKSMTMSDKVRYLRQGVVEFLCDGEAVPVREALSILKRSA